MLFPGTRFAELVYKSQYSPCLTSIVFGFMFHVDTFGLVLVRYGDTLLLYSLTTRGVHDQSLGRRDQILERFAPGDCPEFPQTCPQIFTTFINPSSLYRSGNRHRPLLTYRRTGYSHPPAFSQGYSRNRAE